MSTWDSYPLTYRFHEVQSILKTVQAGECLSLVGLSGSGKSNLLGFITYRFVQQPAQSNLPAFVLIDCNRAAAYTPEAFFSFVSGALEGTEPHDSTDEISRLYTAVQKRLASGGRLCLMLDRFDAFTHPALEAQARLALASNLRALRDAHKYELTYVIATRRPLDPHTELAELFYANTLWLGPLSEQDTRWNIERYSARKGLSWSDETVQEILHISLGYPSLLRAACEACASGAACDLPSLASHPAVQRRVEEFWADQPTQEELRLSGLSQHPLLDAARAHQTFDTGQLTAKEHLLWEYFQAHPGIACKKDDLIRAVWPEDRIFERGIRDDSLAQLVRRLREKIEPDPSNPSYIHTLPGRGYRFTNKPGA